MPDARPDPAPDLWSEPTDEVAAARRAAYFSWIPVVISLLALLLLP